MKITMTTIKSFIKKNPDLYIQNLSRFDGMVDCVMPSAEQSFKPVIRIPLREDTYNDNHKGIKQAWFTLGGDDRFYPFEDDTFKGYEVVNCCGRFILAIKK
jgi:hypothetical protein